MLREGRSFLCPVGFGSVGAPARFRTGRCLLRLRDETSSGNGAGLGSSRRLLDEMQMKMGRGSWHRRRSFEH